jgi:hypothetical protein
MRSQHLGTFLRTVENCHNPCTLTSESIIMLTLSALALATAASLSASPQDGTRPTILPLRASVVKADHVAQAIPSPKLTQMRVVIDANGNSHVVCNVVTNPKYQQIQRNVTRQKGADQ